VVDATAIETTLQPAPEALEPSIAIRARKHVLDTRVVEDDDARRDAMHQRPDSRLGRVGWAAFTTIVITGPRRQEDLRRGAG
jgi:hypothetical protein